MGGFAAAWVGFSFSLPPVIHLLAAMTLAVFAGVAWIALPAFFRTRYDANEVVSTNSSGSLARGARFKVYVEGCTVDPGSTFTLFAWP